MVYLEQIFLWNGKISDNGGVYMTTITSGMIISKKTSQLLLTIPI